MKRSVTKKPKLTKWFDGSVKPVRDGVYQRKYATGVPIYSAYSNGLWGWGSLKKNLAVSLSECASLCQNAEWRGLAENPEVKP